LRGEEGLDADVEIVAVFSVFAGKIGEESRLTIAVVDGWGDCAVVPVFMSFIYFSNLVILASAS
jgi:hypothetical protein